MASSPVWSLDHDREIARRAARIVARHRQRAIGVAEPCCAGRLMRDRVAHAVGMHLRAALQQPVGRLAIVEVHRAVEFRPVEPVLIDVAQEIAGSDRGAFGFQRHGDVTHAGLDQDQLRLKIALGRGSGEQVSRPVRLAGWPKARRGRGQRGTVSFIQSDLTLVDKQVPFARVHPRFRFTFVVVAATDVIVNCATDFRSWKWPSGATVRANGSAKPNTR